MCTKIHFRNAFKLQKHIALLLLFLILYFSVEPLSILNPSLLSSSTDKSQGRVLCKLGQARCIRSSQSMLLLTSAFCTMDIVADIRDLYKDNKWREIVARYHDHPERNKVLWVYPSEENFSFVKNCLAELRCDRIVSIGCGSGLLEWMIIQATGNTYYLFIFTCLL